jgi:hypothetical protein
MRMSSNRGFGNEVLANQLADTVHRYGLRMPALLALEAGRPLAFLFGQFLWIMQPALGLFFTSDSINELAILFEDPASMDLLIEKLEDSKKLEQGEAQ